MTSSVTALVPRREQCLEHSKSSCTLQCKLSSIIFTVLYYTVLYSTNLRYTVLYGTAQWTLKKSTFTCITVQCTLHIFTLHFIIVQRTLYNYTLYFITVHCTLNTHNLLSRCINPVISEIIRCAKTPSGKVWYRVQCVVCSLTGTVWGVDYITDSLQLKSITAPALTSDRG